jgi:ABC transporter substrate binding protein (PQQ-dependent alcohol dehydrogenase system)
VGAHENNGHWIGAIVACLAIAFMGSRAAASNAVSPGNTSTITIAYVGHPNPPPINPFPLDEYAPDEGLAGAKLGIVDDNGTGRFTSQNFTLKDIVISVGSDVHEALLKLPSDVHFVVANLSTAELTKAAKASPVLTFLNAGAADDALREQACLANVLHTIPSRAMLTDALAQYFALKKWPRWFVVVGPTEADKLYAAALKRSATKFGMKIVAEKPWTFQTANAHADTGHVTLQSEVPAFTRVDDYDVLIVADEENTFGEDLIGRTARPRPVAGTQGLVATGWSAVNEQWGALQLQDRFHKKFKRHMTARDYASWLAVRAIGEAAVRSRSSDAAAILKFMRGPDFLVSGFKGQGQSFRSWNGQMRQPILIAGPRVLVSASPQPGFLHRRTVLDTLGIDQGESQCKL